ncbi:MAG: trimeric intracellular cation channel family protein [Helicobacteraceae bacterium]|nr:trimeric intracellular cation channel family protein [Helicobacteraceae bacterium]
MDVVWIFDIIGIIAFAISGFLVGIRKQFDILGIAIMSAITSFGGGIIRDSIVSRMPFVFTFYYPSVTLFVVFIGCIIFRKLVNDKIEQKILFIVMDAIGLVAFAISGALLAIDINFNLFGVIILSFLTAVGGSITRDTIINEIPLLLRSEIYGIIAIYCALVLFIYSYFFDEYNIYIISFVATSAFLLRIIAYIKKWRLPTLTQYYKQDY